jgi:hypothetical protein
VQGPRQAAAQTRRRLPCRVRPPRVPQASRAWAHSTPRLQRPLLASPPWRRMGASRVKWSGVDDALACRRRLVLARTRPG